MTQRGTSGGHRDRHWTRRALAAPACPNRGEAARWQDDQWLVTSADEAAAAFERAGGTVLAPPTDIPVGRLAVVRDPYGNVLVLVDLSKGHYVTDADGSVTGVRPT